MLIAPSDSAQNLAFFIYLDHPIKIDTALNPKKKWQTLQLIWGRGVFGNKISLMMLFLVVCMPVHMKYISRHNLLQGLDYHTQFLVIGYAFLCSSIFIPFGTLTKAFMKLWFCGICGILSYLILCLAGYLILIPSPQSSVSYI